MQLKVYIPPDPDSLDACDGEVPVRTEADIRTAGFAVARAVRKWLRQMPFVPSTRDLYFNISAEVLPDEAKPAKVPAFDAAPLPKRKKKAKK